MLPVRPDALSDILKELQASQPGVRAAFLTTVQGNFLASTQISGMERIQLGGISAAALAIGAKGISDLQLGQFQQIHIVGDAGSIVILRVGMKAVLTLVVDEGIAVRAVLKEAMKAVPRLDAAC
jgi:predicted regulator of Ras-like GTPase activity (Roadblock/LC7/MglB family)